MKDDFVIVKIGKSQELVTKGQEISVHTIKGDPKEKVTFDQVLLTYKKGKAEIGTPTVKGAVVEAEIIEQTKGPKVRKQTYKAKARQRRHVGHRQPLTRLKIVKI